MYNLLMEVYGDECLPHTQVFEWIKRFKDANIGKIGEIVRKNCCLSIRAVAELSNIDKESV
jgi:hypothetical protein